MTRPPLVIYHGNCYDGFSAAWAFRHFLGDADYVAARYGDNPPDCSGRDVYVLDFSYPREQMVKMHRVATRMLVLDHHKTAEADCEGLLFCIFDMEKSGCRLTWDYISASIHNAEVPPPQWLLWVEDRDLWRFRYGDDTKNAHAYIASLPMTFKDWDALNDLDKMTDGIDPPEIVKRGQIIRRYIDTYNEKAAQESSEVDWLGHRVAVLNVPYQNASEMAGVLLERFPDSDFSACYFHRADRRWQFSLRSRSGFDVSAIAQQFGGGGHAGAAGFDLAVLPDELSP